MTELYNLKIHPKKIWKQGGVCERRQLQIRLTRLGRLDKVEIHT